MGERCGVDMSQSPLKTINHVGIKPCGCCTSAMADDGVLFSPAEILAWIESIKDRGMRWEMHDDAWIKENFGYCDEHKPLKQITLL